MKTKKKGNKRGGTFNRIWWKLTSAKTLAAKVASALELVNPAQFHKIKNYFHDFLLFDQPDEVQIEWKALPSDGKHGNVCVVRYTGPEHQSFALLKQGKAAYSDNLMIEYYTGARLNKFYDQLPALVYTHGIYTAWAETPVVLPEGPNFAYVQGFDQKKYLRNEGLKTACDPVVGLNNLLLLTQYVQNSHSFDSMLYRSPHFDDTWLNDDAAFFPIFFQIAYSLYALNYYTGFKHNDLHSRNILVRTLPRPVEFEFRVAFPKDHDTPQTRRANLAEHRKTNKRKPFMQTAPVTFRTVFFAKIIDYGQSTHDETPLDEYKKTPTCKLDRGFYQVFGKKAAEKHKDEDFMSAYLNDLHDFKNKRWSLQEILQFLAKHFQNTSDPETQLLGTLTVDAFNGNAMVFQ